MPSLIYPHAIPLRSNLLMTQVREIADPTFHPNVLLFLVKIVINRQVMADPQ